jgi:hypothetical protein
MGTEQEFQWLFGVALKNLFDAHTAPFVLGRMRKSVCFDKQLARVDKHQ